MNTSCYAVLVTYKTEPETLEVTIRTLAPQVQGIIVVDNSPKESVEPIRALLNAELTTYKGIHEFVANGTNIGIAAAQNIGIIRALELGADYVVFSDHDTSFPTDTVGTLLRQYEKRMAAGERVGAVGPAYFNTNLIDHEPHFSVREGFRAKKVYANNGSVEVSHLIASGLLVSAEVLREVGGFREDFFIDWVDIEWCIRAKSMGYHIYGCDEVRILHRLGDDSVRFLGREVIVHSPFRHYYMIRNAIWLARLPDVGSLGFRMKFLYTAVRYAVFFPCIAKPHMAHFKACWRGFFHGFGQMHVKR